MSPLAQEDVVQSTPSSVRVHNRIREIIGIVVILVLAVGTFVCIYQPTGSALQEAVSATMLPKELSAAHFAPARFASAPSALYARDTWGYSKTYFDGHIVSVAAGTPQVVVTEGGDGLYRVFVSSISVYASEYSLLGAALAPSRQVLAVTRQATGTPGSLRVRDYDVVLVFPSTGKEISMGNGFAPMFVDDTTLLWISPLGVHSRNIVTGETKLLVKQMFTSVVSSATYSPDKTLVAWSNLAGSTTDVYRVETGEKIATFGAVLPLIALSNSGLFSLTPQGWRTSVSYYPLDGSPSRMVHWFPGSYQISKLAL